MGAAYCAGWSLENALERFSEDLTPPRWLRALPRGNQWFLWLMFRLRAWERLLRRYAGDTCFEQLRVPLSTLTVDLVEGREVVATEETWCTPFSRASICRLSPRRFCATACAWSTAAC